MKTSLALCFLLAACQADENNIGSTNTPTEPTSPSSPQPDFGTPRWAVAIDSGAPAGSVGAVVAQPAVDSIGDVVVAGYIGVTSDYVWAHSGFITKRAASDGSERWRVAITGPDVSINGVAIGPDDSIVVVGGYIGTADFGGTTLQIAEDHSDTFIAKYTWDGQLAWARGLSPTAQTSGVRVGVESSGRIVVAGTFANSILVLAGTTYDLTGNGLDDPYIASFDQDGTSSWGHLLIGDSGVNVSDLAIAPNDDVVVVGSFAGSASFGGAAHDTEAFAQGFITRFRGDGLYLSSHTVGDAFPAASYASGVAIAANGDVFVQGWQDLDTMNVNTQAYGVVFALAADNRELWRATQPGPIINGEVPGTIAATPDGHVVSTAWRDLHSYAAGSLEMSSYDVAGTGATASVGSRSTLAPQNAAWSGASAATQTGAVVVSGSLYGMVDFGFGPIGQDDSTYDQLGEVNSGLFVVVVDPL